MQKRTTDRHKERNTTQTITTKERNENIQTERNKDITK